MTGLNDYTPPEFSYDLISEQALLKIAMSGDALALQLCGDLIELFWDNRHRLLASVLNGMYHRGQYVDPVSVLAVVTAEGHISKLPGPYLHTVHTGPGDHDGVVWYAGRVREMAARRNLREATLRLTQRMEFGWASGDDVEVTTALREFRGACDLVEATSRGDEQGGPQPLSEFLDGPTDEDWLVPGLLERQERIILTGSEGLGKAIKIDTPVATGAGWSTMGDLRVGDQVFAPDGTLTAVIAATEVMHDRPCYRITFSDGAQIVADAQHLWLTENFRAREAVRRGGQLRQMRHRPAVVTTQHIAETLTVYSDHRLNHSIPCCAPLDGPTADLPIDPYLLGCWLADGTTLTGLLSLTRADASEIESRIGPCHRVTSDDGPGWVRVRVEGLTSTLRSAGFLGYKHIPTAYMRASAEQRWALLAGLLDCDGNIRPPVGNSSAKCAVTFCNKQLASDVLELLWSLGIKATTRESDNVCNGRVVSRKWSMYFQSPRNPFWVKRKASRWAPLRTRQSQQRYITAAESVDSVPVRCIQVDRPDGMFLVGRECIPTHNSVLCSQLAACMAGGIHPFTGAVLGSGNRGVRVLVVDAENSAVQSRRRYRSIIAKVDRLRAAGGVEKVDWKTQALIDIRPEGLDLLTGRDVGSLEHAIAVSAPDLVVLGPLYKLFNADPSDEKSVREVAWVLDGLRARHRFALLLEAHAGKGEDNSGARRMAPIGSSLWMRWPEFGYGIRRSRTAKSEVRPELVDVISWRGTREERQWPGHLRHGVNLPWVPVNEATARVENRVAELQDLDDPEGWWQK